MPSSRPAAMMSRADLRAGNILRLRADHADLAAAGELVPAVRSAYARHTGRPSPAL